MTMQAAYRIAVRHEGAWINAYVAQMGTMHDSIKIASLLKSAADQDREIFEAWLQFLQAQVDRIFARTLGVRATAFTRHEPDTMRPYKPSPSPAPEPDNYRSALAEPWPPFVLTPEPAPQPEFKSGGGGDYAGAGASGSWDAPPANSAATYDAPPPPPPPEPPPPPPPEPPPPPPPSSDF